MTKTTPLVEFLERNPGFVFHLPEYVESARYIAAARERFDSFRANFSADGAGTSPWEAMRGAVRRAVGGVPAYDGIDWERPDYWESIPLIDKDSIRARADDFMSPSYDRARLWRRNTSGTTGPPVTFWYAPEFFFEFLLFGVLKAAWLAGLLTEEVTRRPVFCVALFEHKLLPDRVWASPDDSRGLTLRPIFDERSPAAVERLGALLGENRPAVLTLKPNILGAILRRLSEPFKAAAGHLRFILSGGSDLDDDLRKTGERLLGVPILDSYGLTEFGAVASECALKNGLHVYEREFIPEVLQKDGRISGEGTGELVLSGVSNLAMPLLRYKTGDLVELVSEPCGCGTAGRRLRNLSGRVIKNFRLSDGSEFSPSNFDDMFTLFPLREFRITHTAPDRVSVEVEFLPSCADPAGQASAVRQYVERELRFLARADVSRVVFSPGDKFQRFRALVR